MGSVRRANVLLGAGLRALFSRSLGLPLATIFACQSVLTMAAYAIPVVIPVAASDLGIEPESVGFLVATIYATAMLVGLFSGTLIEHLGATRLFQLLLALIVAGISVLLLDFAGAAVLCAILFGVANGPMNPTGSQVLVRVAPADLRALVFSLKQCGTPLGGMLAGSLLPALMVLYGWHLAILIIPVIAVPLMLLVPLGGLGQAQPKATRKDGSWLRIFAALRLILTDAPLRAVTLTGFGLATCQMGLATYLVVYLWRSVGYSLPQAGLVFAALHLSGIISRVLLGLIADRWLATRWVLVWLAAIMSAAFVCIAALDASWPLFAVYAVMSLAGASGNGWVGLYFAELARLSPCGQEADIAAGSQFLTYLGIVCGPTTFAFLLYTLDSYSIVFLVFALLALVSGVYLALAGGPKNRVSA